MEARDAAGALRCRDSPPQTASRALPWLGGRPCSTCTCSLPLSARQALGVDLGVALPVAGRPAPSSPACWVNVFTGWPESSEGTGDLALDPSPPPPPSGQPLLFLFLPHFPVPLERSPAFPALCSCTRPGPRQRAPSPRPQSGGWEQAAEGLVPAPPSEGRR